MYLKCIERKMYLICRSDMLDTCGIHAGYMYPQRQSRYIIRDTSEIHAGYMLNTCGIRISRHSVVRGNVSMSSSCCAAHLSGHPLPPCVQMGLLQPPRAAPSSALSWQPLSLLVYHLGRGRSAPPFVLILMCMYPDVSHMYLTCIVNVSCVPCRIHCMIQRSARYKCILMYLDVS
jgi:hypothetical protein